MTAQLAGPAGVALRQNAGDPASEVLHPAEWAALQTGISLGQRDALHALVAAYSGFQRKNNEFYILESRMCRYLRTSFSTFRNYLTALHKLGLVELLSRSPNQWGPRSTWRMRLDVIISNGQLALPLDVEEDEAGELKDEAELPEPSAGSTEELGAKTDASVNDAAEAPSTSPTRTAVSPEALAEAREAVEALKAGDNPDVLSILAELSRDSRIVDPEWRAGVFSLLDADLQSLHSRMQTTSTALELFGEGEVERVLALMAEMVVVEKDNAALKERPEGARRAVVEAVKLVGDIDAVLDKWGEALLRPEERKRAGEIEAQWRLAHPHRDIPKDAIRYAAEETLANATKSRSGYMLGVLGAMVEEDRIPEEGTPLGRGKRERVSKSRY